VHRIDLPHGTPVPLLRGGRPTRAGRYVKVDRADAARFLSTLHLPKKVSDVLHAR
jgi:hypothetical protein